MANNVPVRCTTWCHCSFSFVSLLATHDQSFAKILITHRSLFIFLHLVRSRCAVGFLCLNQCNRRLTLILNPNLNSQIIDLITPTKKQSCSKDLLTSRRTTTESTITANILKRQEQILNQIAVPVARLAHSQTPETVKKTNTKKHKQSKSDMKRKLNLHATQLLRNQPSACKCSCCPYSTGEHATQVHMLLSRLMQLNTTLY